MRLEIAIIDRLHHASGTARTERQPLMFIGYGRRETDRTDDEIEIQTTDKIHLDQTRRTQFRRRVTETES